MTDSVSIGELVDQDFAQLQTGPFGTQLKASEYVPIGVPVINVRNVGFGGIRDDKLEYVNSETADRLRQHRLRAQDIVFGRKGAVERHAFLRADHDGWLQGSDCIRLRISGGPLVPQFVSYFLATPTHQRWMSNQCSHGATMASLNQDILRRIRIPAPEWDAQRRVVSVLAAYDELIENNLRRIEILEEMAQAVYREWFVNFRFPGHEDVPLVDSPLGAIPDGWKAATTAEAFEILGGATPSTKRDDYWTDGSINWFTPSDLTSHGQLFISRSSRQITPAGLAGCSASVFPEGSVMMTSRATIGVVAINTAPACTNQGFIVCLPNDQVSAFQIYFWIKANLAVIDSLASGATFKEISKRSFRTLSFVIPPGSVTQAFAATVGPIFELVENLITQNDNLRATRDLLLPKLVSGELDVSELDIETEWLAS